ncbi:MAG: type I-C CRISPR-associated protein Cas8c/Csd1 [Eubacteriales bacterium]
MQKCIETYDNNRHMIGREVEGKATLAPVYFMSAKAQIEITLTPDGNFVSATEIPKDEQDTLIPVTEKSAQRAGKVVEPHPLCDQLSYIAFGDPNGIGLDEYKDKFDSYINLLGKWANSQHSHFIVRAVYAYIMGGSCVDDLRTVGLLKCDENGIPQKGKIAGYDYEKCLVRWQVQKDGEIGKSWLNRELADCYFRFYIDLAVEKAGEDAKDVCYIAGDTVPIAEGFPKGISKFANGAKLLSANDSQGFTYRGRFQSPEEAFRVGSEASQKAHAALTWLAANQGRSYGGRTFVCWNPVGKPVPAFDEGFDELFVGAEDEEETHALTMPAYADRLQKAISGYRQELGDRSDIVLLAMEAATTGRMSITYYNELASSDYLKRLESWQRECVWYERIFKKGEPPSERLRSPSIRDIVNFCFGTQQGDFVKADDKLQKEHSQRILHCIVDASPIPGDLIRSVVRKASMRSAYSSYNYEKLLFVACAMIRKYRNDRNKINQNQGKEEWSMELDPKNTNRSYLFGRLLAVAEKVERSTYSRDETAREPNAIRLQSAFAAHPMRTWATIEKALVPYYAKMKPGSRKYYKDLTGEIVALFREDDFTKTSPLDDTYLLGYYLQRRELYRYTADNRQEDQNNQENTENMEEN